MHREETDRKESGATAIEYTLLGSLISIAIVLGATAVGTSLGEIFDKVASYF